MRRKDIFLWVLTACMCLSASACDLSHKHVVDDCGYCNACQKDTAIDLIKKDGVYVAEMTDCNTYNETFFRFVGNGETAVKILAICENTQAESVILFSENDDYIASKFDRENPLVECQEPLETGVIYYVRVKLTQNGRLGLTVTPWDGVKEPEQAL